MDGPEFWRTVFGRSAPVEIEIGCGDGAFLMARAVAYPTRCFLGLERSPSKARRLAERVATRDLANVRTLQADARCLVASVVPTSSVAAYHVYFPDPWPKRGHAERRIFTTGFAACLARTLEPAGRLWVATDVAAYVARARECLVATAELREVAVDDDHPGLSTSFARKYRAQGRALYTLAFARIERAHVGQAAAASKMRSM